MIESTVIELLDIGDSAQNMDTYSKKNLIKITGFFRLLYEYKSTSIPIYIFFTILFFVQLWTMCLMYVPCEGDLILKILDYLKQVTLFYEIITNESTYIIIFSVIISFILFDFLLMTITLFIHDKKSISVLLIVINFITIICFYYLIGPIIIISLTSIWCENGKHKYLESSCFSNPTHLIITILSFIMFLLYFFITFLYSFFSNVIDSIKVNTKDKSTRINCNYELYCLITKDTIFIFGFFIRIYGNNKIYKIIYQSYIALTCLIMSFYTFKVVYYYNNIINIINQFGWNISSFFSICILLKTLLDIKYISYYIVFGWIIIITTLYKAYKIEEYLLITENNIFEFKNIKYIEKYKNVLLNKLKDKNNDSKILILGVIKKFEDYAKNNPEINYHYRKLLNDEVLVKKFRKKDELPIISIIYILYSFYSEKFFVKEEVILHMCYFLINKFNNPTYSMLLCSKLKTDSFKMLYYKYLLAQDIQRHLIFKLKKDSNKESIKHVQIGSVILYYLYTDLFKIKIYDATSNQIDYFDLLKNSITTNKTTENFLKYGETILKYRKQIINIWEKIIELNPFSDEYQKDYMLYLDTIIQDEYLSKEQSKKYILKKNSKFQEKYNIYHSLFLTDTSSVLLTDGYLLNGKILYASKNFPLLFMYTGKELLSLTIDDLLPTVVQSFHKELIDDCIKYSNINNIFKHPRDSLLRNKNEGLFNIKIFVKPVPNLYYGLIYYIYLQKIHDLNFIITLDKDLRITGFTEMAQINSSFTMNNLFNLSNNIIGYHIGLIIPDILSLLEYRNGEYNIVKKDYELKGYLYPIEKTKEIKNKLLIILDKIKQSKIKFNDYQGQIEDDPQNIILEFNDFIKELNLQNIKPFSIFYNIKLYTFLNNKYKYYRIYVKNNIITENEYGLSFQLHKDDNHSDKNKISFFEFKSSISKLSKESKKIKLFGGDKRPITGLTNKTNVIENSQLTKNSKNINRHNKKNSEISQEDSYENNDNNNNKIDRDKKNIMNQINSLSLYNSQLTIAMSGFNKMKKDIINKKEITPIKIMKIMCYIFGILTIVFMIIDLNQQIDSFHRLSEFLKDNLFFNKTKIYIASLYTICVNMRWMSHSLFINDTSCLHGNWPEFYKMLLWENLKYLEIQKNLTAYLGKDFNNILNRRFVVEFNVHRLAIRDTYDFTLDNLITYIITSIIRLMDLYDIFISTDCKEIPKEVGLNETKLHNLITQTYNFYFLNISGYTEKEKLKRINKNFSKNQIPLIVYSIFLFLFFIFILFYVFDIYKIEIYFLDKLINFNSPNFENYTKKLDEIKKKLRSDNREEDDKENDMDFKDLDTKNKDEEDREENDTKDEKKGIIKEKKKKKRGGNKQNKIQQLKKKKLKIMTLFFSRENIFLIIKIFLIMIIALSYYLVVTLMKAKYEGDLLDFDSINDSIYGIYKESYDVFITLKRELDLYEKDFFNCKTLESNYKMNIPNISNIITPKLGNLLMQITGSSNFEKETINKFKLLYSENACEALVDNTNDMPNCERYWSGVLLKGMEQAITHMGIVIGSVINELQILNDPHNNVILLSLINQSSFITYEQFTEYYLLKAYNKTTYIFEEFHEETLDSITLAMKYILWTYSVLSIILFIVLTYFIYNTEFYFYSFLNFIGIVPSQYLYEDENLYREIIKFGNKYY